MTHGGDDVSLIPGCMSPSSGEEEPLFGCGLTGSSRTCAHKYTLLILSRDDNVFLFFCLHGSFFQIQFVPGGRWTPMHTHTWLMFTVGRVSLAGLRLAVILVTTAGCGAAAANPQVFVGAGLLPWRPMGLWGPLLELEDDLLRMKAISTVGSGLQ